MIGTDGTFSVGQGEVNLLGGKIVQVMPNLFWLNSLRVGVTADGAYTLGIGGQVQLPVPGRKKPTTGANDPFVSAFDMTIDSEGKIIRPAQVTFAFDTNPKPLMNGGPTEFRLGNAGAFEITGAAIDFNIEDPLQTTFYGAAALHVVYKKAKGSTPAKSFAIPIGNALNIREKPGIMLTVQQVVDAANGLAFPTITLPDLPSLPDLPEWDLGFLKIFPLRIPYVDLSWDGFRIEFSGTASFNSDRIKGSVGYEGLVLTHTGIEDWGRPTGAFSADLSGIGMISIPCITYKEARYTSGGAVDPYALVLTEPSVGSDGAVTYVNAATIQAREYLQIGGSACGAPAATSGTSPAASTSGPPAAVTAAAEGLRLTLKGGTISGGVREILYYEGVDGNYGFRLVDVGFALSRVATLNANMDFALSGSDFKLSVAGVGVVGQKMGMAATGMVGLRNGELTMGVFLAKSSASAGLLPASPGTITMTGFGGGFFLRPTDADLQKVTNQLAVLTGGAFRVNNPRGRLPQASDLQFGALLYAQFGVIGAAGIGYAMEGNGLLTITDQFTNLDVNGVVAGEMNRKLTGTGNQMQGGLYLTVKYPPSGPVRPRRGPAPGRDVPEPDRQVARGGERPNGLFRRLRRHHGRHMGRLGQRQLYRRQVHPGRGEARAESPGVLPDVAGLSRHGRGDCLVRGLRRSGPVDACEGRRSRDVRRGGRERGGARRAGVGERLAQRHAPGPKRLPALSHRTGPAERALRIRGESEHLGRAGEGHLECGRRLERLLRAASLPRRRRRPEGRAAS